MEIEYFNEKLDSAETEFSARIELNQFKQNNAAGRLMNEPRGVINNIVI